MSLTNKHSPFIVVEEFCSPLMCEEILDAVDHTVPNTDKDGKPVLTVKTSEKAETLVFERILGLVPTIEERYGVTYKGTDRMKFEWYPTGSVGPLKCDNSTYVKKKWLRISPYDFTGLLFLSEYEENPNFDADHEVYGGKVEFPQHQFGFNPKRGSLVIFPSGPHFIHQVTPIKIGSLQQVRINIVASPSYIYDPRNFPGNYTTWFK
jgi:hypothetical protein